MSKQIENEEIQGTKEEFLSIFKKLCDLKAEWQVWDDVISMIADSISNSIDKTHYEKREEDYMTRVKQYKNPELIAKLMANIVEAFERNPDQDYLGTLYQDLGLSSHWKGQFFTPLSVARLMADIDMSDAKERLKDHGYITINDPSCGAGATLIAAASSLRRIDGFNYQTSALFTGNDIDPVVAKMCYIQLSFLGCPGYVAVANTLSDPVTGDVLMPTEKDSQDFWYTPMYCSEIWAMRRRFKAIDYLLRPNRSVEQIDS